LKVATKITKNHIALYNDGATDWLLVAGATDQGSTILERVTLGDEADTDDDGNVAGTVWAYRKRYYLESA